MEEEKWVRCDLSRAYKACPFIDGDTKVSVDSLLLIRYAVA
jgi:hypothetical protein